MKSGCFNRDTYTPPYYITAYGEECYSRGTTLCRQVGERREGAWHPLPECEGCLADKDEAYISESRINIDRSMK